MDQYGAVLVQGPPGTGKTHTIANLIGHLLSQGSSVLVTSHTEKALKVLKDKVYKDPINKDLNLQSLCISLLSSKSQKEEMDAAINEIAAKGTSLDLFDSKNKIIRLEDERKKLIEESKKKSNELLYYRSLEYKDIVYGNETIKPIEAAKFIKSGIGNLDYIGGSTSDDTIGLSISSDDLIFLYDTNDSISTSDEEVLKHRVPDFSKVWTPQTFKDNINFLKEKESQILRYTPALKFKDNVIKSAIEGLNSKCKNMLSELENFTPLQQMLISKSIEDRSYPKLWAEILSEFERLIESYEIVRKIMLDEDYDISAALMLENPLSTLDEIIESGKEIPVNFFAALSKPKWKAIKGSITNNGRPIEYRKDWLVVHKLIQYELDKAKLVKKINRLLSESSSDLIVDTYGFEVKGKNYQNIIISSLSWYENKWIDLINEIAIKVIDEFEFQRFSIVDFNNPISSIEAKLNEGLIPALEYQITQIEYAGIQAEWAEFLDYLDEFIGSSGFVNELILAANQKQMDKYQASYLTLSNVLSKKESFMKRKRLLNELGDVAREWARAIEYRQGIHGKKEVPDSIQHAWKWLQLSNQIRRIDEFDPNKAQKYLLDLNMRLTKNAQILAYEKAWFEKIKNRTPAQAQAIEGWRTTIRQIGKATGKKAPALMKKARELMPLCQSAIPVWIMPLNRVVENFDPRNNKFDVVIIDEASQSNILALAALYLGKKIIIVGDDEQVSPDSVGMKKDEVDALIEQYLTGIPNSHLFNGQTSLYDIAKSSGFRPLMLTEHFRCLPEIIGFSNALSYNGRIKPLRDSSRVKIKPAVIEYRVPEGLKSGNKTNVVEAE
ncbi:MAG TPA: hypothetical protein DEO33_03205, partial [Rikenellaceae bacterium]|nr:hypothetical protein [Rikenellaceae bacterium]